MNRPNISRLNTSQKRINDPQTCTVGISVLDKEYQISCLITEEEQLKKAAKCLDQKMKQIRTEGKLIGLERIALMAGLNLASDLLKTEDELISTSQNTKESLLRLMRKVDLALDQSSVLESNETD